MKNNVNQKSGDNEIKEFMEKVKKIEKSEKMDLSSDEDLSIGIMNLISIEEHLFFTYNKTNNEKYLDVLNGVREMRKGLLKKIIKDYEGEVWCISKHLLAASMRIMEVGTKALNKGDKTGAADLFKKSYNLYSLFWGLNLGLIKTSDIKSEAKDSVDFIDESTLPKKKASVSIFSKLGAVVQKAVDCCKE